MTHDKLTLKSFFGLVTLSFEQQTIPANLLSIKGFSLTNPCNACLLSNSQDFNSKVRITHKINVDEM